jgi:hypothetical protein
LVVEFGLVLGLAMAMAMGLELGLELAMVGLGVCSIGSIR